MKRRLLIGAGTIGACVVALVAVYSWTQSPVTNGGVRVTAEQKDVLSSQMQLVPFDTPYFSTSVPSYMQRKSTTENASAPVSGMYLFTHKQLTLNDQLAITTGTLSGPLSELSTLRVRLSDPDHYRETNRNDTPDGARVFERLDGYEVAVFWPYNGRYASVVVGGSADRRADLESALTGVLANWQWR